MDRTFLFRFLRFIFVIAIAIAGGYITFLLSTLTYPFIIAFIIAFLINPIVQFFEVRTKMPRGLAVFIVIILMVSMIAGLLTLLIAEIINGTTHLAKVVPDHFQKLISYMENFIAHQLIPVYNNMTTMFRSLETNQQETILTNIQNVGEQITTSVGTFIKEALENIPSLLSWLPDATSVLVFSLLATFFISKDWNRWQRLFSRLLPDRAKKSSLTIIQELQKALFGFVRAQLTLISITTVIVLIGLVILKVKYAMTIALIIGLVDLLPYLGTGLVFVPWIIYLTFSGNLPLAIGISILYVIVLLQRQFMEPKILSTNIGIDPFATLVALFVGFKLVGFLGLIIGPVVLVILKTLHTVGIFQDIWTFIKGAER
ncbi:sporulation integral membrane protein YtvI [Bacillus sp. FJAT-47783]|uniref:sporulation integral membrane protein YtvI n=1 Tax=Bacillus sp. FJAT-47783 TaxID=2922712 RepID=UPI001FABF0C3|nr:sporulation integral membrane protein YtvI [Bacillus sp. FJAT-47783]